ncbi:MAG: M20/M25/M40 family metallo-hydrolase [Anaerolineaceae bacterium]|jgi:carboxypeptidase PM20D1
MLVTILILLFIVIIFLVAFVLIRTALFARPWGTAGPAELIEVDAATVADHLAAVVQCKTLGDPDPKQVDHAPFSKLHQTVEKLYPTVHKTLERIDLGTDCLVYHWKGSQPDQKPVVLTGHIDVVPVEPGTESQWEHDPFGGEIADGFIWGRGTLDDKGQVIAIFEAIETLIQKGYKPERDVYLAFGNDEELNLQQGAVRIAAWMKEQGIRPEMVLDEGGQVVVDFLDGVSMPVAMIGNAEKGYLTLELTVDGQPGHSSMPPQHTAIGILSQAVERLEANPMPHHPERLKPLMKGLGPAAPFIYQLAFSNLWLFGGVVSRIMAGKAQTDATIRTTTAVTVVTGGTRDNVLPRQAKARVNFRLLPDDTIAAVCDRVRKIINDPRVTFEATGDVTVEASVVSPDNSPAYRQLETTIRQIYGNIPSAPYLVLGFTDARYYTEICEQVYRFTPFVADPADMERVHGINERIGVETMGKMVQFYAQLLKVWSAASTTK